MRILYTLVLLFSGTVVWAQTFTPPVFPVSGKSTQNFILPNWHLKTSSQGDLNGDMVADLALVMELKDTLQELRPDGTTNLGSPRVLLILFKDPQSGFYKKVSQHNTFILRHGEGAMEPEPFGQISIKNRVLDVSFEYLRSHAAYKFRYQQNEFKLIGATTGGVSGEQVEKWDFNFSTNKALHEWGGTSDQKLKHEWKAVPVTQLKSLQDLLMPQSWEVLPNVII
ncbi:hypothetical protein TH63_06730 [Rufibacter radiotolerans]|uniref:Uncharacterized protein n=1 Tax=Rufibacter radiotolerans TaxID=1379910 RepID=A0A0H4VNT3_9BACT|nr:hypothetical protein [Rufibacter radiotolerans]AKQ45399.1 hypothetical protein TH63_06730 [Rufibacter radiotolerans]